MLKRLFASKKNILPEQVKVNPIAIDYDAAPPELEEKEEQQTPRTKQKNIKTTDDVILAFRRCAKALNMTESVLFEDMVAEMYERLKQEGRIKTG